MTIRTVPWSPESGFAEFQQRFDELTSLPESANEAEVRLKILDALLFDVLDWEKSEVDVEQYCREVGFADYVFSINKTVALVIEAKRAEKQFTIPNNVFNPDPVAFALLEKESKETGKALRQALGYAASLGICGKPWDMRQALGPVT